MASTRLAASAALRSLPLAAAAAWGAAVHFQAPATSCDAVPTKPKPKVFKEATCISNTQHTHNTRLVTLKLPSDWNAARTPVANVLVKTDIEGEAKPVVRPYNPLSAKSEDEVTLLVKKYGEDAKMGTKLHELAVGESILVKGPNMQWSLPDAGAVERYTFIAGGTGITPILQAAEGILRKDIDAMVNIVTFNDTPHDVLLRNELMDLVLLYGANRVRVKNFWGMPNDGMEEDQLNELQRKTLKNGMAYPTKEVLEQYLPKPTDCDGHVMVLVCGPMGMLKKVAGPKTKDYKQGDLGGVLKDLGFAKEQVWKL
mmetsp:Transcript_51347/g.154282  ORF Transcript_51347/g.154282 Transcript_51347/m.154282 type:complete len:313 (-) Transcript_51347:374-1312(-)|eukprot:CAMPEP_0113562888 /NCGR_PEP_ID=MMETSP0015_2-20120614/20765_1 /TAXON_ID=2838 /ORGANISM="Odontella" /LENGTH=312 /DNA_ID=CAMNT_0000464811 /DNA_START=73 /DNA_END=1011 /DNA_ORIENTATION=+ /assembly_acc=CAM_ASM_000160